MKFVILFEDAPGTSDIRTKLMPDHLSFLDKNAADIQSAGPLFDAQSGQGAGGLWLVEAKSWEAAQTLVEADPFWPTGLRQSVRILQWKQVFRDGVRQI